MNQSSYSRRDTMSIGGQRGFHENWSEKATKRVNFSKFSWTQQHLKSRPPPFEILWPRLICKSSVHQTKCSTIYKYIQMYLAYLPRKRMTIYYCLMSLICKFVKLGTWSQSAFSAFGKIALKLIFSQSKVISSKMNNHKS